LTSEPGVGPTPVPSRPAALGGASLGIGVAILVARRVSIAAAPGQLPGFARANGFDPRRDAERYVIFVALAIAGALAGRWAIERLARERGPAAERLRRPAPWLALASAPILALTDDHVLWIAAATIGLVATAAAWHPPRRSFRPSLVAAAIVAQTVIAWSFLGSTPLAKAIPLFPLLAILVVAFAAIAHGRGRRLPERGIRAFAPSLLFVPIALWRTHPPSVDIAAGVAAVLLPMVFAVLSRRTSVDRVLRGALPVMLATTFVTLGGPLFLRPAPAANLFEDGHPLLPASEYLAGRLPYRDIVPGHGLFTDGLIQAAAFRVFGADYRGLSRGGRLIGALYWPLVFCLGAAATGRADVGFWSAALSFLMFPGYFFLRAMASLALLASAAAARRRSSARAGWIATGVLIPFSLLWAVEFAFYGAVATLAALFVSNGRRFRNLTWATEGTLAASAALAAILAAEGILGDFVTTTFRFIPSLAPAYSLGFGLPAALKPPLFPDSLASLADPISFFFWCLLLAIFGTAVLATQRRESVGESGRALLPFLVWFLVSTLSVIERHHLRYPGLIAGTTLILAASWIAGPGARFSVRRTAAALLLSWAVVVAQPIRTAGSFAAALDRSHAPRNDVFPTSPKRLDGAAFSPELASTIARVGEFISRRLGPDDTWLDFTSTPALYFYFDRRCPIRYYEVAFYEAPDRQREVIRAIEANPRVRAVLVHLAGGGEAIDGIPNSVRAPLVWDYVRSHFHPADVSDAAKFWMRDEKPAGNP